MKRTGRLFLTGLLLFTAWMLPADEKKQDTQAPGLPVIESYKITPNEVGTGDLFTMTIIVNHENSDEVEFPLKELPASLQLWRGPYIRSFIDTGKDGNSLRKVSITATFKPQKSGRMIIPSLSIFVDSALFQTEPRLLRVGLYKNRKLYMPLEVEWRTGFEKIYAGEAVPLYLTVKNQEAVVLFDHTRVALPRDGFFEKAGGIGEITSKSEGKVILYDIPAATYLYTSPVAGEVKIPSAGVDFEGITGWTDNLNLSINRPPAEIKSSGAVGVFDFNSSIVKKEVAAGEDIVLTCSVTGDGNLNYLKLPEPVAEGCLLVSSEETDDYKPSIYGFTGSKTVKWTYISEEPGASSILLPEFYYLNKQTDEVVSFPEKEYRFLVSAVVAEPAAEPEEFPFGKISTAGSGSYAWKDHYKNLFRYIWLIPGLIFFLLVRLMKGKKIPLAGILSAIILISIFSAGQFFFGGRENSAGLNESVSLYNQAVDDYNAGNLTASLHNIRTAVYMDPVNSQYREVLEWIESNRGFLNSIRPSVKLHPDIFYFVLIGAFNLFFLAAVLKYVRPGGGVSVLLILFGFLIIFSGFMIYYIDAERAEITAVICREDSSLKKIPMESAETWILMREGTAVKVMDESENFILVETGLGVKGWITRNCVIPDRPEVQVKR